MNFNDITVFILNCLKPFKWLIVGQFFVGIVWAVDLSLRPYLIKTMLNKIATLDLSQAYSVLLVPAAFYIFMSALVRFVFSIWLKLGPPLRKIIVLRIMDKIMDHSYHMFQNYFARKIKDVMTGIPGVLRLLLINSLALHNWLSTL